MSKYAQVNVKFGADISQFSTAMQNAARDMKKAGDSLQNVGKSMAMNITAPIVALGAAALYSFGQIDALKRGLISFTGSAELAEEEFNKLREVAKLPGIGLEEAVRGSINLQAIGMNADKAREAMSAFGNAIATVGGGKESFDLAIRGFGQLMNASKPLQQDLYQIANQLPQINKLMIEAFGTNRAEDLAKMGISGKQLADFLVTELGKLPKVTGGIKNSFENMSDSIKISLAGLGESLEKNLNISGIIDKIAASLSKLTKGFAELNPTIQFVIISITALAATLGPVLYILGSLTKILPVLLVGISNLQKGFALLTSTSGILGISLVAFGALIMWLDGTFDEYTTEIKETSAAHDELAKKTEKEKDSVRLLVEEIKKSEPTGQKRLNLINQFNSTYGTHIKNIKDEVKFTNELDAAYKNIIKTIENKALVESYELDIKESVVRQRKLEEALEKELATKPKIYQDRISPEQEQHEAMLDILRQNIEKEIKLRDELGKKLFKTGEKGFTNIPNQTGYIKENNYINKHAQELMIQNESIQRALKSSFEKDSKITEAGWLNLCKTWDVGSTFFTNKQKEKLAQIEMQLNNMGQVFQKGIENMVVNLAMAFGENLVDGDPFKNLGNILLSSLGNLMVALGSEMIVFATLSEVFRDLMTNPLTWGAAIPVGIAMVAAGAAISKIASKGMQPATAGSGSYSGGSSYGSSGGDLTLHSRVDGRDLVLASDRTTYVKRR